MQGLVVQMVPVPWKVLVPMQPLPGMVSEQVPVLEQQAPSWAVQGFTVQVEPAP